MRKQAFQDKIAIVTGASAGIGRSTALALARQGSHLALSARRKALLDQVAAEIEALGRDTLVFPADVTDPCQVQQLVEAVIDRWGRVDILVSNAGEYIRAPLPELSVEHFQRSLNVNFYGGIYATLAVLPFMQRQHSGHIVFVTSMAGKLGIRNDAPYVAAKFALTGFSHVLRQELRGSGVRVSNVLPGRVDTVMIEHLRFHPLSAKIPAEAVARAVLTAIEKNKAEVIIPPLAGLLYYIYTLSPRLGDALARLLHLEGWET
jgi:NADP-dependent 3-hydroxy acid dehydrogenase YdfG